MIGQIVRLTDTEEIAQQTGIEKIEFRAFDNPFGEIIKVRRQQMNNKSSLKNRNPLSGRGMGDATIGGKGGEVQQLSCAAGAEPDKTLEYL
jgi:hypothetical protein